MTPRIVIPAKAGIQGRRRDNPLSLRERAGVRVIIPLFTPI